MSLVKIGNFFISHSWSHGYKPNAIYVLQTFLCASCHSQVIRDLLELEEFSPLLNLNLQKRIFFIALKFTHCWGWMGYSKFHETKEWAASVELSKHIDRCDGWAFEAVKKNHRAREKIALNLDIENHLRSIKENEIGLKNLSFASCLLFLLWFSFFPTHCTYSERL